MKPRKLGACIGLLLMGSQLHAAQQSLPELPGELLPVIAERLAEQSPAYKAKQLDGAVEASNATQAFHAVFDESGMRLETRGERLGMSLSSIGRGDSLAAVASISPEVEGQRIVYRHDDGVSHWFVNSPLGLEQVVSLEQRPQGEGELRLGFDLGGSLEPALRNGELVFGDDAGKVAMRYGRLVAVDATGRELDADMMLENSRLVLAVNDREAVYPLHVDPLFSTEELLHDTSGTDGADADYGYSVAIDGSTVVIGAPLADYVGTDYSRADTGAIYIYERDADGNWSEERIRGTASAGYKFGYSVALEGDSLVVGEPGADPDGKTDAGRVYVYMRDASGVWSVATTFDGEAAEEKFGSAVAVDVERSTGINLVGNTIEYDQTFIAVGSPMADSGDGRVDAYWNTADVTQGWQNRPFLRPLGFGGRLGSSVDIDGYKVIAGAPNADTVFIYESSATGGWPFIELTPPIADESFLHFGESVAIDGDLALVGAPYQDIIYSNPVTGDTTIGNMGGVHTYIRQGIGDWDYNQTVSFGMEEYISGNVASNDLVGQSVALSPEGALVGAPGSDVDGSGAGRAIVFQRNSDNTLTPLNTLAAADASAGHQYGTGVALADNNLVVGALNSDNAYVTLSQLDLSLVKQDSSDPVEPGSNIEYSLIVSNDDTEMSATGVMLVDTLPADTTFVSAGEECNHVTGVVTCSYDEILPGESRTAYINASADSAGTLTNQAEVSADQLLLNSTSASDSESTTVNTPPLINDKTVSLDEDSSVEFTVSASDADGDALAFDFPEKGRPTKGELSSMVKLADGSGYTMTYTPDPDVNGTDSLRVTVSDGTQSDSAVVTFDIAPVNDAPVADDIDAVTDEDTPVDITLSGSDVDGDDLTVWSVVSGPANGTAGIVGDVLNYSPDAEFSGTDTITYTVSDGTETSVEATITITVNEVNDAPVAEDTSAATPEETAVSIPLIASDAENDTLVDWSVASQPANGSVVITGSTAVYEPEADFVGEDSFSYTVSDGTSVSEPATVTVTVNNLNDAPVADDKSVTTAEDQPVDVTLSGSDQDGDTLVDWTLSSGPSNGTATIAGNVVTYSPDADFSGNDSFSYTVSDGTLTSNPATVSVTVEEVNDLPVADDKSASTDEEVPVEITLSASDVEGDPLTNWRVATQPANGSVVISGNIATYTPANDYFGEDSFTYTVSDGSGDSEPATVTVSVNNINDAPVADGQSVTTVEDEPVTVVLSGNDADGDTLVNWTPVTQPDNGVVVIVGNEAIYTPDADFNGTDSFAYTVSDGTATSAPATVNINVTAVNDAPVAWDNSAFTSEDTPVDITLGGTDVDGDSLSGWAVASQPANGAVSISGNTATYTPDSGFSGLDSFSFTVTDGDLTSAPATVTVSVSDVNHPPIVSNLNEETDEGVPVEIVLSGSDGDGDTLVDWQIESQPGNGSVTLDGNVATYTPDSGFYGEDSFTYSVSDGIQRSNAATVTITVTEVNVAPVADAKSVDTDAGSAVAITLSGSDADGDSLSGWQIVAQPTHGSVTLDANIATYTPDAGYTGSDSFSYTVSDGQLDSAPAEVTVKVNAVVKDPGDEDDSDTGSGGGGGGGALSLYALLLLPAFRLLRRRT